MEQLNRLQPFGEGNPEPLFSVNTPESPFTSLKQKHVKWKLNGNVEIIGWNCSEPFTNDLPSQLAVNLGFNEFRGHRSIQLNNPRLSGIIFQKFMAEVNLMDVKEFDKFAEEYLKLQFSQIYA